MRIASFFVSAGICVNLRPIKFITYFSDNYRWSAGLIIALGTAPWGSSDLGEVDRVGKRLKGLF